MGLAADGTECGAGFDQKAKITRHLHLPRNPLTLDTICPYDELVCSLCPFSSV